MDQNMQFLWENIIAILKSAAHCLDHATRSNGSFTIGSYADGMSETMSG